MELISKKTFQFILLILMNIYEPISAQLNLTNEKDNFLTENEVAFKDGEWLEFRVHYGIFNAYKTTLKKFFSSLIKCCFYFFYNKKNFLKYKHRFLGLLNSYLGNKSYFRIKL